MKDEFKYYSNKEIKKLLKSNERLVYVDDNITEVVIRYKDIPDFIVDYNNKYRQTNLVFYAYGGYTMTPIITTIGCFLDRCDREVRKDIIDRLIYLQQGGKIHKYKIIDEYALEIVRDELGLNNDIKI